MPVVIPAGASSSSTAQVVAGQAVFDYILDDTGAAVVNAKVTAILNGDFITSISPQVIIQPTQKDTTTDGNGFWQLTLIPNTNLSPANTTYTIITPFRSYDIQVGPSGPYQSTSTGTLISIPTTLGPATSSVIGGLTVSAGLIVSAGGATITGGLTIVTGTLTLSTAGFTMAGPLTLTAAASQVIPGATSFSVRDTGNANDNLLVSNAGLVTARAGLVATAGGVAASAGDVIATTGRVVAGALPAAFAGIAGDVLANRGGVSPGTGAVFFGSSVAGGHNLFYNGTGFALTDGLTISAGGLIVTAGGETITAGNLTLTAGNLTFAALASQIVPGATSLSLRNNANAADNVLVTDAGLVTLRNGLLLPAGAAGALAPNSAYATVAVKIDDQLLGAPAASITFTNPLPTTFRHLFIEWYARGDTAAVNVNVLLRFNNISTATYEWEFYYAAAAVNNPSEGLTQTSIQLGVIPAATATANYFGQGSAEVKYYQGAVGNKLTSSNGAWGQADGSGALGRFIGGGKWRTVATAVTRIDLLPSAGNFVTGSLFTLWGIP